MGHIEISLIAELLNPGDVIKTIFQEEVVVYRVQTSENYFYLLVSMGELQGCLKACWWYSRIRFVAFLKLKTGYLHQFYIVISE